MLWTSEQLEDQLAELRDRGQDSTDVEVKLGAGGCPALGDTLCAFGNMPGGGTIIIGLDEANGFEPVGVADPALIEQGVASQARNAVTPPVQVSFQEAVVDGAVLVLVSVTPLPSNQRPCRYQGNAYLRQSDGDYVMSEQEIQQLLALRERPRNDAKPVEGSTRHDLDQDLTREFVEAARRTSRRLADQPEDSVLLRKGVLAADGVRLTVAGLYALGAYPQQFVPSLSLTAAVTLDPRSGQRTRDLVHLDGPLPELLESAVAWVERNTITTVRFGDDGHGRDQDELPLVAVRELIANALVHRDLGPHTETKRVEVRLRADELVITNPGGLYGVSVQQLGTPAGKSAVNEFLYDICKLVRTSSGNRVIEGEGGGIREVQRALRAANMRPPKFIDQGVRFTVMVPRHALLSRDDVSWLAGHDPAGSLSEVQKQIVTSMRHGQSWNNALVRDEFAPIDSRDARASLQGLVAMGFARVAGERGQTEYSIDPQFVAPRGEADPDVVVRVPGFEPPEQETLPIQDESSAPGEAISAHAPTVWAALATGPTTLSDVVSRTGLTRNQARFALSKLRAAGYVSVSGGQGVRVTTYARRS